MRPVRGCGVLQPPREVANTRPDTEIIKAVCNAPCLDKREVKA